MADPREQPLSPDVIGREDASDDKALAGTLDMFDAEIARPTDVGSTILRPGH